MNEEVRAAALKNALIEIRNVCPDINNAVILMDNGTIISGDDQAIDPNMEKAVVSLQSLTEKADSAGGLDDLVIDGDKGKVYVSQFNGMYSVMALSKRADLHFLSTVTGIILPTVLKVLDNISSETTLSTPFRSTPAVPTIQLRPAPIEPLVEKEVVEETVIAPEQVEETERIEETEETEYFKRPETSEALETATEEETEDEIEPSEPLADVPSQQLIVDRFGGFMVRADTVQLDAEILERWSSLMDVKEINEVDIETFRGKTTRCKVKIINDQKYEGRGLVRIPEKTCDALEIRRGELVRVKPIVPQD